MPTGAKARRNMSRFVALGTLAWSACVGPQRHAAVAQRPAANASAVSSDASRPFDLQALLKREATGLTLHTFRALNGTFSAAALPLSLLNFDRRSGGHDPYATFCC
jgi:hypothetical protein